MKDYYEMLNRRKPMEDVGDAFKGQADAMKPMNVGQRREQALMRGIGAGINMGARAIDEAKIRELQGYSKQIAEQDMMLKMTAGKNLQIKAENENFFLTNRNDLATLNDFLRKGDFEAVNVMAPTLIENYKKITGREIGEYAYSRDGKVYLDNGKGEVKGMYLADIFQGIIPEAEQMNFPELLTYNSKVAVQGKMEEMRLKNEQIRAQIENLKAHGELYKSQAKEVKLSEYDKALLTERKDERKSITDLNNKHITDLGESNTKAKNMLPVVKDLKVLFTSNDSGFGSSKWDEFVRGVRKFTGNDAAIQRAEYLRKYYFPDIKGIAGNPNQKEWVDLTSKIVSASHNKEAVLQELNMLEDKYNQSIEDYDATAEVMASTGNKIYHYDPQFSSMVEETKLNRKNKIREENRRKKLEEEGKVRVMTPQGETKDIDKNDLPMYIQNGAIEI